MHYILTVSAVLSVEWFETYYANWVNHLYDDTTNVGNILRQAVDTGIISPKEYILNAQVLSKKTKELQTLINQEITDDDYYTYGPED